MNSPPASSPSPSSAPGPSSAPAPRRPPRYLLHATLFLITFLTTTAAGALFIHPEHMRPIGDGLSYSVPLLLILVCHELGHYFVARAHGVDASLPFFIPLPPGMGLGTMGAVIGMSQVTRDRRKLIDIGAAGPLCGLAVAIPVIIYGLTLSNVVPPGPNSMQEGNSLLYALLKFLVKGAWLPGNNLDVNLHPTAWAGWAGLLVTMINLLPIGQLDGGHIATAYFGNRYGRFARVLHRLLPVMAIAVFVYVFVGSRQETVAGWTWGAGAAIAFTGALPWLIWFIIVSLVGRISGGGDHPPVDDEPLPRSRRVLFWVVAVAFVAILMPVPYRPMLTGDAQVEGKVEARPQPAPPAASAP